jgi:hypothetical protein
MAVERLAAHGRDQARRTRHDETDDKGYGDQKPVFDPVGP